MIVSGIWLYQLWSSDFTMIQSHHDAGNATISPKNVFLGTILLNYIMLIHHFIDNAIISRIITECIGL